MGGIHVYFGFPTMLDPRYMSDPRRLGLAWFPDPNYIGSGVIVKLKTLVSGVVLLKRKKILFC
jgi:hypothetical protein